MIRRLTRRAKHRDARARAEGREPTLARARRRARFQAALRGVFEALMHDPWATPEFHAIIDRAKEKMRAAGAPVDDYATDIILPEPNRRRIELRESDEPFAWWPR